MTDRDVNLSVGAGYELYDWSCQVGEGMVEGGKNSIYRIDSNTRLYSNSSLTHIKAYF